MSLPRFDVIVIDAPETPATYVMKYVMMRILLTLIFGVIFMMAVPTWAYGLILLSQTANTWLTRLWGLTHLYDSFPISLFLFDNPFTVLMVLIHMIPWAIFIPVVEGLGNKYVPTPPRNSVATIELILVKIFTYIIWTSLLIFLCMLALRLNVVFDRLESLSMFQDFFVTFGRAIQMGIFFSYGTIIMFNAYHNSKFIPEDEHSPIRSLQDTMKEIAARKWEEVAEDDEFQTIRREETIYRTPETTEEEEKEDEKVGEEASSEPTPMVTIPTPAGDDVN